MPQPLLEAGAGYICRHDISHRPDRPSLEQRDQVGMLEPRCRSRLAQNRRQLSPPDKTPRRGNLSAIFRLQERVFRQIDNAEAAAAQLAENGKPAELPGYSLLLRIQSRPYLIEQPHHVVDVEIVLSGVVLGTDDVQRRRNGLVAQ